MFDIVDNLVLAADRNITTSLFLLMCDYTSSLLNHLRPNLLLQSFISFPLLIPSWSDWRLNNWFIFGLVFHCSLAVPSKTHDLLSVQNVLFEFYFFLKRISYLVCPKSCPILKLLKHASTMMRQYHRDLTHWYRKRVHCSAKFRIVTFWWLNLCHA